MKKLLRFSLLCVSVITMAQETARKIPNDAIVVGTIKGENLLQLISMDELNQSFIGQSILKDINRKNGDSFTSLEDFGLDLRASSHYFYQINDSITYNSFVIPIKEISKFENFIKNQPDEELVSINGIKSFKEHRNETVVWNETSLVITKGSLVDPYFDDEDVMNRYGLEIIEAYDYYSDVEDAVEATEVVEDSAMEAEEVQYTEEVQSVEEVEAPAVVEEYDYAEPAEVVDVITEDYYNEENEVEENYYSDDYNDSYYANDNIKEALKKEWELLHALSIINLKEEQSIIHNKAYQASLDKNAEATLWVKDFGLIYANLLGGMYYNMMSGFNIGSMYANTSLTAKIFAESDEMKLSVAYTVNDQLAKSYKKITSKKLNKKFFKYVNEDRMVGFMSYAINTKAALEEYPAMLKNMYGNMPMYGEEAMLAVDLVELLLDEEAIAKVFPGDMLFLLSGISQKEVTYTSYEYDDDYEYTEVEKTKKETVPDFLLMISTEDPKFLNKLISYGTKKEAIVFENGIFSIQIPESPLDVHFLIKNGILFMGTSQSEMNKIAKGNYDSKVSKKHKKLMRDSNYTAFLNGKQLASKIPVDEMNENEMSKISYFLTNATNAYITSSRIKGNVIEAEMVVEVPEKEVNSLQYMFNIMEALSK